MTSARTCYCKQEGCVLREEDNDIVARSENRHPATVASRKSITKSRSSGGSPGTARSVVDDKKLYTSRSIEAQTRDPVLSPETSIALENAERIVNDAKIQLAEVRVVSGFDSARRERDTYADDLPLDDEIEELLYIRELVSSKIQETSYPGRPGVSGEENAPRISARRVDLSAPKFQTSQRRCVAARTSLEYGTADERRSQGRASLTGAPNGSKDSPSKDDEATTRDNQTARNHRRVSSTRVRPVVHPDDGGVCRIQIGPPVHVNGELTRQDLEDVHISPVPSSARRRVNAATYILRHESVAKESSVSVDKEANDPVMTSRARRRARLAASSREKREKLIAVEGVVEMTTTSALRKLEKDIRVVVEDKNSDDESENEQNEPIISQVQDGISGEEKSDEEVDLRDAEDVETLERPMASAMNEEAADTVGKSQPVPVNAEMNSNNDVETRYTKDGGIFNKKSGVDSPSRPRNEEHVADKIKVRNRGDQSQPSLASADVSRRANFPRRENIARFCRTTASLKQYRTIDEYLSNTFNSHDGPDEPCDVVTEELRRSRLSWDDFSAKADANEVELYRPRLDELDSTLLSNDKKIKRAVRAVQTFAELLSRPEFAKYKAEESKRETSRDNPLTADLLGDQDRRNPLVLDKSTTSSSGVTTTTSKNQAPGVSSVSETRRDSGADSQEISAAATDTKSSGFPRRNVRRRDDCSQKTMESIERPVSGASDSSRVFPDEDDAQQSKSKAHLSDSSMDKSDIMTFSNLPPALSSTRTDTQTYRSRQEQIRVAQAKPEESEDPHADSKPRVTSRFENSANKTDRQMKERYNIDNVFAPILRGLKDETTDRFVACILQDERRSIEGKVAKALNESVIAPTMMEKLLARLQEADSIGDGATRRTETLDVLKDILINVKSRADEVVDDKVVREEKETEKIDFCNISPRALEEPSSHEENKRQMQRVASNENEQLIEDSRDPGSRDERSKTQGPTTHTILSSGGNGESKKDSHSEGESLKRISDILSDEAGNPKENSCGLSPTKTVSVISQKESEVVGLDAAITTFQDENGDMRDEGHEYKSGVKDGEDLALGNQHANESIPQTTTGRLNDAFLGVSDRAFVVVEEKEEEKEIAAEKTANDSTSCKDKKASSPASSASRRKDKRAQSDVSSGRSKVVDETSTKKHLARSLIEEKTRSSRQAQKDISNPRTDSVVAVNGRISPANSVDSLRDCVSLRTLSSAQSDESPLKETQSRGKDVVSLVIVGEGNSTKASNESDHDRGEPMTNGTRKNRGNKNQESAFPKSARSGGNEQLQSVASMYSMQKSLFSSSSSIGSTTLDHNGESNNGAFGDDTKRTGVSSEMSHSEGELYMPSSCSYSLGEVRILEKGDLIADSTIERDSSITILVTRSMLTSLNDSSTPLGSSGYV